MFVACMFPFMLVHIDDVTLRYLTGASSILPSAFVSRQFAIAGLGFDQLSARFYIEQLGMQI